MRFEFKPAFERSIKTLSPESKEKVIAACLALIDYLDNQTPLPGGLGLKRLRKEFWQIRQGIHNRVLFRWRQDYIEFILAGDHDEIRDFLKSL